MNLGGVRVPSNPDLFWRSSMSGLDGFRLGESLAPPFKGAMRAFRSPYVVPASAGGAPTLPDALDCLTLKTAVQPKETKGAKEFEGFTRTW